MGHVWHGCGGLLISQLDGLFGELDMIVRRRHDMKDMKLLTTGLARSSPFRLTGWAPRDPCDPSNSEDSR